MKMGNIFGAPSQEPPRPETPPNIFQYQYIPRHFVERDYSPPRARPRENDRQPRTRPPCLYFARGTCARGDACRFSHDRTATPAAPPAPPRHRGVCRFFANGHCKKGDACLFLHSKDGLAGEGGGQRGMFGDDLSSDNSIFEIGGAWVTFDNGATISKVSLPSDFSALRISNLPQASTLRWVIDLLSDVGVSVSPTNVRITGQDAKSAIIRVEDPTLAKTICNKLRTCIAFADIEANPIPVPMPPGSSLHQVDCRRVRCSWHRPSRTAQLYFETDKIAYRVQRKFNCGEYKISDCRLTASTPTRQGSLENPQSWEVRLTGLPGTAEESDLLGVISVPDRPMLVDMGDPTYVSDAEIESVIVKSMLLEFGPLEWWDVSDNAKGKRVKAQGSFVEEPHARDAVSSLNNTPLSFCESVRLTLRLVTSAKFKVSTRVYNAISGLLNTQKAAWETQHLHFIAYPPRGAYRNLKLEGENHRRVAEAKEALERIISGEVMRIDGKDLWYANLASGGGESNRIKKIEKDFDVVITRDMCKSQFRFFGPPESYEPAAQALQALIHELDANLHIIYLSADESEWVSRGGLGTLRHRLNGVPCWVLPSSRRRLFVRGSPDDRARAQDIVYNREVEPAFTSSSEPQCAICWCEAEEPVRTSCGHFYCGACFVDTCLSGPLDSQDFCISCKGDEDRCKNAFALSELQEHLPSQVFEQMLEASFASYVRRHPADFRYCPTPDCSQIYRIAAGGRETPATFTCTRCLAAVCPACHCAHPGRTCAEHRGDATGGYEALHRIKAELGIQDCPRCATSIEKTEGCNHMTCRGCGIHICWICLATFPVDKDCYSHMNKMHGNIHDNPVRRI
ncbi:hypothetical protein GGS23DRAFT_583590 [Durotheca rogersii]|uniref:uncharacterized protein n=1 Tax=Durotheca rogersii TaxID=419775 RepID=UPI0022203E68|nr:uncharacterized protein GGS23DRAFT_583590 [Durotheca rogersii]KAI5859778.1 hypothetical protein GGS23DRAFT_583590 [Durotheca rogersii]